jgi:large subunit ribosomal protein L21
MSIENRADTNSNKNIRKTDRFTSLPLLNIEFLIQYTNMNYAIVESGGKQYKVVEGTMLEVDFLPAEVNEDIIFDKVLLHVEDGKVTLGSPYITDMKISGKLVAHVKGDKVEIYKFRAKSKYRRHTGFRHSLSQVQIGQLGGTSKGAEKKVEKKTVKKVE